MTVRREYVGLSLLFLCLLLYLNAGLMEEVYKCSMYFLFFFSHILYLVSHSHCHYTLSVTSFHVYYFI